MLQKKHIGNLSAYCGAAWAGCASVCGIAYMDGATIEQIGQIIVNAASTVGGMVCDGAKSSCAGKIAVSVFTGLLAYEQVKRNNSYKPGEGMIVEDAEQSIANIGRMGREGMKGTDIEILKIMIGQ
ncbi:MAG: L-serine ammonia-lyase, iron-sulfur-dependent, subunit alpha [Clostridia bacterium]|nr:L-serine ammonia-lyase, iron-sulfur-dependent, subunit alpha [Clostridia bacterium]